MSKYKHLNTIKYLPIIVHIIIIIMSLDLDMSVFHIGKLCEDLIIITYLNQLKSYKFVGAFYNVAWKPWRKMKQNFCTAAKRCSNKEQWGMAAKFNQIKLKSRATNQKEEWAHFIKFTKISECNMDLNVCMLVEPHITLVFILFSMYRMYSWFGSWHNTILKMT